MPDNKFVVLILAVTLAIIVRLDGPQLLCGLLGAAVAVFLHLAPRPPPRRKNSEERERKTKQRREPPPHEPRSSQKPEPVKIYNVAPVLPRTFSKDSPNGQMDELVRQLEPSPESRQMVREMAQMVELTIRSYVPAAKVLAVQHCDISRRTAFGVAVPDVEIVVCAPQADLIRALAARVTGHVMEVGDADKLHKHAVRVCSHLLIKSGDFQFRRCSYRAAEPKVTLVAPSLGGPARVMAFDFSVNIPSILRNAALIAKCSSMDPRFKQLVLVVRRWAKDRGIAFAPRGHLPPFAWTILVIYYLQVGRSLAILGPLRCYDDGNAGMTVHVAEAPGAAEGVSLAELFKGFMFFYKDAFDWSAEIVCLRLGTRGGAAGAVPLRAVLRTSPATPCVEDPFKPHRNLASAMSLESCVRLRGEFARACNLLQQELGALAEVFEPYVPPEQNEEGEWQGPPPSRPPPSRNPSDDIYSRSRRREVQKFRTRESYGEKLAPDFGNRGGRFRRGA